jgi:hypothetical protein
MFFTNISKSTFLTSWPFTRARTSGSSAGTGFGGSGVSGAAALSETAGVDSGAAVSALLHAVETAKAAIRTNGMDFCNTEGVPEILDDYATGEQNADSFNDSAD